VKNAFAGATVFITGAGNIIPAAAASWIWAALRDTVAATDGRSQTEWHESEAPAWCPGVDLLLNRTSVILTELLHGLAARRVAH
jgi:hypothetical protein